MSGPVSAAPRRSGAEVDPLHPHHLVIHEGYTYLHSRMDGTVGEDPFEGLYDYDTRLVSWHRITLAGKEPVGVAAPSLTSEAWQATLNVRLDDGTPEGPRLPQDTLELLLHRRVGLGMSERLDIENHSMVARDADLVLEVGADFRDLMEVGKERRQHGTIAQDWDPAACVLTWHYTAEHEGRTLERGVRLRVLRTWATPRVERMTDGVPEEEVRSRLSFTSRLEPRGRARLELVFESLVDGRWRAPVHPSTGEPVREVESRRRRREAATAERAIVECEDGFASAIVEQAADDLLALRNWDLETQVGDGWIVNAGVPVFTGFFGRDSMAAGMQAAMLGTGILRGALIRAAATQGTRQDDVRDEQPGRIVHEMRRGPLSDLGIRPHARYYGSHTGPAAFVLGLREYWLWTGDADFVRRLRPNAEAAMAWAADWGDLDGDGLLEYLQRSPEGLRNQGWKDSAEAIRYPDGRIVPPPIATVEEQAFHYAALQALGELLAALGDDGAATAYRDAAARIRSLVEDRYWLEDEGFYALAIDADGAQVRTITSNPLHLLHAGLPSPDRAHRTAERLMRPDLFSGWGIRTLSKEHPSYNPFAYHLGTVWPVESASFAAGAKQYGCDEIVERLVTATFTAAGHCHRCRLPEVLSGHDSTDTGIPTTYPNAKSPQAWSASGTIALVRHLLGLRPRAAERMLELVRPRLPEWLPDVTIRRLQVGEARVDIRFERERDGSTTYVILEAEGDLEVRLV